MTARDKKREDNKDGDQHSLWSEFYDGEFDNTEHTHFTFFANGGIRMEQDRGNDEVNYQHVTAKMKKVNAALGQNMILLDNNSTCNVFYAGNSLGILENYRSGKPTTKQ